MKTAIYSITALALIFSINVTAQNKETKKNMKNNMTETDEDKKFILEAAGGGMLEVMLARLAATNATAEDVKNLGNQLVKDHEMANAELKTMAEKKNVVLPTILNDKRQKKYDDLVKKKGKDFDKAYVECMKKDHKKDIDMFQKEADKGDDAEVKSWAANKLPILRHHLEMAESCEYNMSMTLNK